MTKKIHKGDLDKLKEFAPRIFKDEALEVVMQAIQNVEEEQKPQWPSKGDEYYYIHADGDVVEMTCSHSKYEKKLKTQGNIFRTEKEAEAESERRAIMQELRECDGVVNPKVGEERWHIYYNQVYGTFNVVGHEQWISMNVYFSDQNLAVAAIKKLGDTKLRKLFRVEGE